MENYLVNLGGMGFDFTARAEDTFIEIRFEVHDMLRKKIYGYHNVDAYRDAVRNEQMAS